MVNRLKYLIMGMSALLLVAFAGAAFTLPSHQVRQAQANQNPLVGEQTGGDQVEAAPLSSANQIAEELSSATESGSPAESNPAAEPRPEQEASLVDEVSVDSDIDSIIKNVSALIERWESQAFGKAGWFHTSYETYWPIELRGNAVFAPGMTSRTVYPDDVSIRNDWYYVDEEGYYELTVGHTERESGEILQRIVQDKGQPINLTFWDLGPEFRLAEQPSRQKVAQHWSILYILNDFRRGAAEVRAWNEGNHYRIVAAVNYPDQFVEFIDLWIVETEYVFVLDMESGALLSREVAWFTKDGERYVSERITIRAAHMAGTELPPAFSQTVAEATLLLEEAGE
jgi:hypothetical protein